LDHFLGVAITRGPLGEFRLSVKAQIEKMLRAFHLDELPYVDSPYGRERPTLENAPQTEAERQAARVKYPYQQAVGHLTYVWFVLHCEITFPLKIASTFSNNYGKVAWNWVKQIMLFLKNPKYEHTIIHGVDPPGALDLSLWTDSDHANCTDTRKSLSGAAVFNGRDLILCESRLQRFVALNSYEAEIMAASHGITALDYIRHKGEQILGPLLAEQQPEPIPHHMDNGATIDMAKNPVQPGRNRHMHCRYFHWTNHVAAGITKPHKVPSKLNVADVLVTYKDAGNFHRLAAILRGHAAPRPSEE
jgi:hypothetical protein